MPKKVLFISSANPLIGPGAIGMDYYNALLQGGYDVDFLTLKKVPGFPNIKYIYDKRIPKFDHFWFKLNKKLGRFKDDENHHIFYMKESQPPVAINKILSKIRRDYDIIIVFFWQGLLSYKTLKAIYDLCKPAPKVIFISADYSPMTGGCHFPGKCENYKIGCGNCPVLVNSKKKDFTSWNVAYRENVIKEIKPHIFVNTYMSKFFRQSPVINSGAILDKASIIVDTNRFYPQDRSSLMKEFNIPTEKKFIILFGCQNLNDPRKGMQYLIEALNLFWEKLTTEERKSVLLLSIGKDNEKLNSWIKFERKHLGYVDFAKLPKIYSLASVFLSPSVNDAGPSMVNQSLCCGTPVISFEMGTALDVITDFKNGYKVPLKNSEAFAEAINKMFHLTMAEYNFMRHQARDLALKDHSYDSFINKINSIASIDGH